jgi:NAD(P)-dependent dehydrogenase (short-subunit alcohol dehydrogenase family)
VRNVNETVILVTGATDGLGKQVAHDLALKGATVLLHGRDQARGEATVREIREETGNDDLHYHLADFSSLEQVRRLAEEIQADYDRLDVLINNAGIGSGTDDARREVSDDGHELRFAVNYLAPFLLTRLLLPLLRRSAPSRIVNVASAGQSPIDFDDPMLEQHYDGWRAYSQSKLALVMFTFDLVEQLKGTGVSANSLHPASLMDTKMVFESFGYNMTTVQQGADATVHLAISPELEGLTGRYFDGQRDARANEQAYDRAARHRLRRLSEEVAGLPALGTRPKTCFGSLRLLDPSPYR